MCSCRFTLIFSEASWARCPTHPIWRHWAEAPSTEVASHMAAPELLCLRGYTGGFINIRCSGLERREGCFLPVIQHSHCVRLRPCLNATVKLSLRYHYWATSRYPGKLYTSAWMCYKCNPADLLHLCTHKVLLCHPSASMFV